MKAYHFLSQHPKFEVEFLTDGSKPPPKHPNSIRKGSAPDALDDAAKNLNESKTFIKLPSKKECPSGREQSKRVNAINLIVYKVSERAHSIQDTLRHYRICG